MCLMGLTAWIRTEGIFSQPKISLEARGHLFWRRLQKLHIRTDPNPFSRLQSHHGFGVVHRSEQLHEAARIDGWSLRLAFCVHNQRETKIVENHTFIAWLQFGQMRRN